MFDIGKLLERLRARPYDEVRYHWDKRMQIHTFTCYRGDQKASYCLTEEFRLRFNSAIADQWLERFDAELWEKSSGAEAGRGESE